MFGRFLVRDAVQDNGDTLQMLWLGRVTIYFPGCSILPVPALALQNSRSQKVSKEEMLL